MSPDLLQITQPPFLIQNFTCGRLKTRSLIENSTWVGEALNHIATRTFTISHRSSKFGWEPLKMQSFRCFHIDQRIARGRTIQIFFSSFFILQPDHHLIVHSLNLVAPTAYPTIEQYWTKVTKQKDSIIEYVPQFQSHYDRKHNQDLHSLLEFQFYGGNSKF